MMSYEALVIAHVTGLALAFMGLAGVLGMRMGGGSPSKQRWIFFTAHGLGLLLLLASGLALVSRLGLMSGGHFLPGWVQAKLLIWLAAGGAIALASRLSRYAGWVLLFFIALAVLATWLGVAQPF